MTSQSLTLDALKQKASAAIRAGHVERAEQIWIEIIAEAPRDPDALFALGFHAQLKSDSALAIQRFRLSVEYSPADPMFRLSVAKALKANGDVDGHLVAITAALDADPYFVPAHLILGAFYLEQAQFGSATQKYRDVLKIVGPRENWPEPLIPDLEKAEAWLAQEMKALVSAYQGALTILKSQQSDEDWGRIDEAVSILSGISKPFHQEPVMLNVPRLPAIPFYRNSDFAWASKLEAQSHLIIEEFTSSFMQAQSRAVPYVAYAPGAPVNQWAELNHSKRWNAVFFYKNGIEDKVTAEQFPKTLQILKGLPLADIADFCPNVMFSTLAPKSKIPPHTGETNARLVVHLPLIVPEKCRYRVGNEWRSWEVGKPLIFDDSIEHEAINDSDFPRSVLIFDVWNPHLSSQECDAVRALLAKRADLISN